MFEVTPDDIALLNDKDLRALAGQLCEAELRGRGLSASFVTWGGDQDAGDGGVDVDVALPAGTAIEGFIPRPSTGFQVKAMKMPPGKIIEEMRPAGTMRPVIQEFAAKGGAYIIISSESTSHAMLQSRLRAMAEAVKDLANRDALKLDFYDRTRVASWVRDHAGLVPWVREKIGKAIPGWRPYSAWAYAAEGVNGEYLLDDRLRVDTGQKEDGEGLPARKGLEHIRLLLNQPGKIARLVGLSGVGKTRFLQALFDGRIGDNALAPTLAIYTNIADEPDPQPMALVTDLIAAGKRAIVVIDNCPPELHRRLSDACRSEGSKLSLVTVEYDVREDQPEATDVFRLEPSSPDLIAKLIKQRFPALSFVNAHTIADHSGGNARIALAIAGTVGKNETISGLGDDELFRRLFQQGHVEDRALLLSAQALALVYSFHGENVSSDEEAELVNLGALIGNDAQEMFRYTAELQDRDLVQRRGVWRAVLPHALANYLAKRALRNIPFSVIDEHLIKGAPARLSKSFSRRLGYLADSNEAIAIVKRWLAPDGLLQDVANLNDLGQPMFENVAPVAPEAALSAIERVLQGPDAAESLAGCARFVRLLRHLAHDAVLFDRSIAVIRKCATAEIGEKKEAREIFTSFFFLYLSGTHAPLDQRLSVVKPLLASEDPNERSLAVNAVKATLEAFHFTSSYNFEFGARSRDPGYWPSTVGDVRAWFRSALVFAQTIALSDFACAADVRDAIAAQFRGLWTTAATLDELEGACHAIAKKQFWREGWIAVRETQRYDSEGFTPDESARLAALEQFLRPVDLAQNVRALVLSTHRYDLDDHDETKATPLNLGKAVALDEHSFNALLEELLTEKGSNEHLWYFGRGLAEGAINPGAIWERLRIQVADRPDSSNYQLLRGFLEGLQVREPELTNAILDNAVRDAVLERWYPLLETATKIDDRGVQRLMGALDLGKADMRAYRSMAYGRAADPIPAMDLRALVLKIAVMPDGFDTALEILYMRMHSEKKWNNGYRPETLDAGRQLMRRAEFSGRNDREDYRFAEIVGACMAGDAGAEYALEICRKLKNAFVSHDSHPYYYDDLLGSLFTVQPIACLDGFCGGDAADLESGMSFINNLRQLKISLLEMVQEKVLVAWCDEAPSARYPAVAGCINISTGGADGHPREWTKLAVRLLEKSPDRVAVLREFVREFRGHGGWGSQAAIFEANAKLLDSLEGHSDPSVKAFVMQEKARLAHEIAMEKQMERSADRTRDERFE